MYEENNSNFVFKNIILKLLLVIILVVLVIWLFPTKSYVDGLIDNKLGTSKEQIFNSNINSMKEAAIAYYTGSRVPSKEDTITLEEMLDKKLLMEFKDSNNKKCDVKKSFVSITKNKEDYTLKVNLSCDDKEGYVISYLTYNSAGDVYEKKKLTETPSTSSDVSSSIKDTAVKEVSDNSIKSGGYYTNYGPWSNWSTNYVKGSNTRQVETKNEKVQSGTIRVSNGSNVESRNALKVKTTLDGKVKYVYVCPSDYDNHGTYDDNLTCYKTVISYVDKALYKNVTYYRYRDRNYINN